MFLAPRKRRVKGDGRIEFYSCDGSFLRLNDSEQRFRVKTYRKTKLILTSRSNFFIELNSKPIGFKSTVSTSTDENNLVSRVKKKKKQKKYRVSTLTSIDVYGSPEDAASTPSDTDRTEAAVFDRHSTHALVRRFTVPARRVY